MYNLRLRSADFVQSLIRDDEFLDGRWVLYYLSTVYGGFHRWEGKIKGRADIRPDMDGTSDLASGFQDGAWACCTMC